MKTTHDIYIGDNRKIDDIIYDNSIDLIVTSPPYFNVINYGDEADQIGFGESYDEYKKSLSKIFNLCYKKLKPDRRMCVNIVDITKRGDSIHKIIPLGSDTISLLCNIGFGFVGDILWNKISNSNGSSGHTRVFGSYPYPYKGRIKLEYEHIIIVYKPCDELSTPPQT